jgi:hypothetical protein
VGLCLISCLKCIQTIHTVIYYFSLKVFISKFSIIFPFIILFLSFSWFSFCTSYQSHLLLLLVL